jgi:hypothetical protein
MAKKSQVQKDREKRKRIAQSEPVSSRSGRGLAGLDDLREMIGVGRAVGGLFAGFFGVLAQVTTPRGQEQQESDKSIDLVEDAEVVVISSKINGDALDKKI